MFNDALIAIRQRLKQAKPIQTFAASRYPGIGLNFFIGLKPEPEQGTAIPIDLFPYVAVSPLTHTKPVPPNRQRREEISIMFGLIDQRFEDGIWLGVLALSELGALIDEALSSQPLNLSPSIVWDNSLTAMTDRSLNNPYFEGEIILTTEHRQ